MRENKKIFTLQNTNIRGIIKTNERSENENQTIQQKIRIYHCGAVDGSGDNRDVGWPACPGFKSGAQHRKRDKAKGPAYNYRPGSNDFQK
ncbi:unnamed protein product [marine sediment metagenome]|uniref:Uncharacterized protein n=1 Tax=marine sediment metagenome TaxID=412755 RepID=X1GA89_9ZZZZ